MRWRGVTKAPFDITLGPEMHMGTPESITARDLSRLAKKWYTSGPFLLRKLQHWRPYILPI
jgi:hypothetical protein